METQTYGAVMGIENPITIEYRDKYFELDNDTIIPAHKLDEYIEKVEAKRLLLATRTVDGRPVFVREIKLPLDSPLGTYYTANVLYLDGIQYPVISNGDGDSFIMIGAKKRWLEDI